MKQKSIKKNAVFNLMKTFLNIIFPLLTFPYITRVLEADNIGKLDFSKSIVNYFILISSFGISQYAIREGSVIRKDKRKLNTFLNEVFSISIITTMIAFFMLLLCIIFFKSLQSYTILLLVFSLNILSNAFLLDWLYTIEEDFAYTTIRSFFIQLISLVLMVLLVRNKNDYIIYALITTFSLGGATFFNYTYSKKYVNLKFSFKLNIHKHFKPMFVFFLNNVTSSIYLNSDITIIGFLSSNYYVGIYSVAVKIYMIIKQLSNAVLSVSIPKLTYFCNNSEHSNYNHLLEKILNFLVLVLIPSITGIIMLRKYIIYFIAGPDFSRSTISLSILSITLLFSVLSAYFVYGILIPNKLEKNFLVISVISAMLNILVNFILVPVFYEVGAAISTMISEIIICFTSYYFSRKLFKIRGLFRQILSSVIGSIIVFITCIGVINTIDNKLLICIVSVIVSSFFYFLFLLFTKNPLLGSLTKNK